MTVVIRDTRCRNACNWVQRARDARDGSSSLSKNDYAELQRLRAGNAELADGA